MAIIHKKLADFHFEVLKHPDLAPSDYYLYPNLKKRLKGTKFLSNKEAILAAHRRFAA
jgi:hypothetical protein